MGNSSYPDSVGVVYAAITRLYCSARDRALILRANNKTGAGYRSLHVARLKRLRGSDSRRESIDRISRDDSASSRLTDVGLFARTVPCTENHRGAKWRPYRVSDCPRGPSFTLWRAILQAARATVPLHGDSSAGRDLLLIERRQVTAQSEFNSSLPTAGLIAPGEKVQFLLNKLRWGESESILFSNGRETLIPDPRALANTSLPPPASAAFSVRGGDSWRDAGRIKKKKKMLALLQKFDHFGSTWEPRGEFQK